MCQDGQRERGAAELARASGTSIRAKLACNSGLVQQGSRSRRVPQAPAGDSYFGDALRLNATEVTYRLAQGDGLLVRRRFEEALRTYWQASDPA